MFSFVFPVVCAHAVCALRHIYIAQNSEIVSFRVCVKSIVMNTPTSPKN